MLHKLGRIAYMLHLAALFGALHLAVAEQQDEKDITSDTTSTDEPDPVGRHMIIILWLACGIAVAVKFVHLVIKKMTPPKQRVVRKDESEEAEGSDVGGWSVHRGSLVSITIVPPEMPVLAQTSFQPSSSTEPEEPKAATPEPVAEAPPTSPEVLAPTSYQPSSSMVLAQTFSGNESNLVTIYGDDSLIATTSSTDTPRSDLLTISPKTNQISLSESTAVYRPQVAKIKVAMALKSPKPTSTGRPKSKKGVRSPGLPGGPQGSRIVGNTINPQPIHRAVAV